MEWALGRPRSLQAPIEVGGHFRLPDAPHRVIGDPLAKAIIEHRLAFYEPRLVDRTRNFVRICNVSREKCHFSAAPEDGLALVFRGGMATRDDREREERPRDSTDRG